MRSPPLRRKRTCEKHDLVQSGKSSMMSWPDVKLIPQTNKATLGQIFFIFSIYLENLVYTWSSKGRGWAAQGDGSRGAVNRQGGGRGAAVLGLKHKTVHKSQIFIYLGIWMFYLRRERLGLSDVVSSARRRAVMHRRFRPFLANQ